MCGNSSIYWNEKICSKMAEPIVFINSHMANFISGICLVVDYADQAMKSLGIKEEMCKGPAILHFD